MRRFCALFVALVSLSLVSVEALAGRWGPPRSPTMRGTTATIDATKVGPGAYSAQASASAGGWSAPVSYPASIRGVPVTLGAMGGGSLGQLARALGGAARVSGPAVFAGLLAAWVADNAWQWDPDELAWFDEVLDPPGGPVSYKVTSPCDFGLCSIYGPTYQGVLETACLQRVDTTCSGNYPTTSGPTGGWCGRGTRSDGSTCASNRFFVTLATVTCLAGTTWNGSVCVPQSIQMVPLPDAVMDDAIEDGLGDDPNLIPDAWDGVDGSDGPTIVPDGIPADPQYSGPPSVSGDSSSSSSTGPDGVTTTTKDTEYGLDYGEPGQVIIEDRVTEDTTHPDGTTTTQTSTDSGTSTATGTDTGTGGGQAPPPPIDVCVEHPDASGCQPFGTMEPSELATVDQPVTFGISSVSGSCPAPVQLDILGTSHALSWQPLCDLALGVAPIVRALGALSAGLWLIAMMRR